MIGQLTPTQVRMAAILSDGMVHTHAELFACLEDDLSQKSACRKHITRIRQYLRPKGETIVCVWNNHQFKYQHVRLLANAHNGKR